MAYYDTCIIDRPQTLVMLNGSAVDTSGNSAAVSVTGTIPYEGAGMVDGPTVSANMTNTNYVGVSLSNYMNAGSERQPFTIEAWVHPGTATIITHSHNAFDGLCYDGTNIWFGVGFSTGLVTAAYRPNKIQSWHLVGVFTGTTLILYVNGEAVASRVLTDTELAAQMTTFSPNTVYSFASNTTATFQALATYSYALPDARIKEHYSSGMSTIDSANVGSVFGGLTQLVDFSTSNRFLNVQDSTDDFWLEANYNCAIVDGGIEPSVDSDLAYKTSSWTKALTLDGNSTIAGVFIDIDGYGTYAVETSIDGGTNWTVYNNREKVAGIAEGFDGTDKTLLVRVSFVANNYGRIESLTVRGIIDNTQQPAEIVATPPVGSVYYETQNIKEFDATGVKFNGNMSFTTPAASVAVGFWYYATSNITTSFTPTGFFENGLSRSARTVQGRWTYVVYRYASTSTITITGNATIAYPTFYSDDPSATDILNGYKRYIGNIVATFNGSNVVTFGSTSAVLMSNNWSPTGL